MKEEQFHTVELTAIRQITVEDILRKGTLTQNLDYAVPIPTRPIGIPQQNRDMGFQMLQIRGGVIDYGAVEADRSKFERYRGRLGC